LVVVTPILEGNQSLNEANDSAGVLRRLRCTRLVNNRYP
jgi:hypothetical protein